MSKTLPMVIFCSRLLSQHFPVSGPEKWKKPGLLQIVPKGRKGRLPALKGCRKGDPRPCRRYGPSRTWSLPQSDRCPWNIAPHWACPVCYSRQPNRPRRRATIQSKSGCANRREGTTRDETAATKIAIVLKVNRSPIQPINGWKAKLATAKRETSIRAYAVSIPLWRP